LQEKAENKLTKKLQTYYWGRHDRYQLHCQHIWL